MNVETWKITPKGLSGLHLGKQGMAQERSSVIYHSDSLFSAIVLTLALTSSGAELEKLLAEFLSESPPFLLTSAFPYAENVRFFPLPMNIEISDLPHSGEDILTQKEIKKIAFVSESIFIQLLADISKLHEFLKPNNILNGGLLIADGEMGQLPTKVRSGEFSVFDNHEKRPHVAIGRAENASSLYFNGAVHFAPGCGLWFGITWRNEESPWKEVLPALFAYLEDEGIGGERSSGYGQVQINPWQTIQLPAPAGNQWVTLSRYLPNENEYQALSDPSARYALDPVGGWLRSPGVGSQRRRTINMLREGSVLGPLDSIPMGKIVDVQPVYGSTKFDIHPVYRSGLVAAVGFSKERSL